ncbi:hypothetical protein [Kutzneria kofuensis]|uniref:hypothetical protein n=1 Tax=Kutzneria kofuensis TaxID=103725 RepID=UPI0031EFD841
MTRWVRQCDFLTEDQRRRALLEIGKMYARRQQIVATRRAANWSASPETWCRANPPP